MKFQQEQNPLLECLQSVRRAALSMRVFAGLLLTIALEAAASHQYVLAQATTNNEDSSPHEVLKEIFPPVYPPDALAFRIEGDVNIKVSIRPDGSIESVTTVSGDTTLAQAALESVKRSQFECPGCGASNSSQSLTYSFQLLPSRCCTLKPAGYVPPKTATQISRSENHITITGPSIITCQDACGVMDQRMRIIAGDKAVDCGRVKIDGNPKPSLMCARKAISRKQSFMVRFDNYGTDSFLSDGFAGDGSGKVYSIKFDDLGWTPDDEVFDEGHNAVQVCPKPVRIWRDVSSKGVFMGYRCIPWQK